MKKNIIKLVLLSIMMMAIVSCSKDSLEPEVKTERDLNSNPISSVTDLKYIANGMYKRMRVAEYYGRDYIIFNEARTDDAYSIGSSNRFVTVSEMRVNIGDAYPSDTWTAIYRVISNANLIINADNVTGDSELINDYKGQALATRAMAHFDLLKLYGQQNIDGQGGRNALTIPYVKIVPANSQEASEMTNVRNTFAEVRDLIYADLDEAIQKIANTSNKTKISKQMVLGLKSRIALNFASFYPEDYQTVLESAQLAISEGGSVIPAVKFDEQFSGNVVFENSIFELAMPSDDNLGNTGLFEIYNGEAYGDIVAQSDVASIYEPNDVRLTILANDGTYLRNVGKYTSYADNVIIMRLEEILLNAAEAAIHVNPSLVLDYLNQIRAQRNVAPLTTAGINDVLLERRKELIFEGFRFDDLMRLKLAVPVNPRLTDAYPYGHFRTAFPIPLSEINANDMQQNYGY